MSTPRKAYNTNVNDADGTFLLPLQRGNAGLRQALDWPPWLVVQRHEATMGLVMLPRPWVFERTIGWRGRFRR